MDTKRTFNQLYEFEYSEPFELALRLAIITGATALFTIQSGWIIGAVWLGIYYSLHALNFAYFRLRRHSPTKLDVIVLCILYNVVVAAYIWLPGYLLVQDSLGMQIAGATAIMGMLLWLIRRSDVLLYLMWSEVAVFGLAVTVFLFLTLPKIDSVYEQFAVAICSVGLLFYFALTLYISRTHHTRAEKASIKSAEAQKMEALGHLAGGVAHDFNNILTATMGNLELYGEITSQKERDDCVKEALLAVRRGEALVKKLLAFGRRSAGQSDSVMIADIIDSLRALSRRLLPAPIHITITAPQQDLVVHAGGEELTTALLNLIVNARDAMPGGGWLTVTIAPHKVERAKMMLDGAPIAPGHYVRFDVADNGPGMPPEVLHRVLEPFYTTKPEGEGVGLGLPLVSEFARAGGGGLTIATSPDGTCVTIYLPSEEAQELEVPATAA